MKLSEAILLGSTVLAPQAGKQYSSETKAGCALGMAAVANGCTFRPITQFNEYDRRTLGTEGVWGNWVLTRMARPCKCWRLLVPREMRIKDIIAHIFDYHVMGRKNWTLEQLVEWVKTVEPNEAAPPAKVVRVQPSDAIVRRQPLPERQVQSSWQEAEEWQAVRQAFAAKYETGRKRGPATPRNWHRDQVS
jgi:hypothetical protein